MCMVVGGGRHYAIRLPTVGDSMVSHKKKRQETQNAKCSDDALGELQWSTREEVSETHFTF